ncbi:zinc finger protein 2 homolog [Sergentomyia squamirostris]
MEVDEVEVTLRRAILEEQQEYMQLCRFCFLTSERNFRNMKQSMFEGVPYNDIYNSLTGRQMVSFGKFVPRICAMCEIELIEAFKFRRKCLLADDKVKNLLEQLAPEPPQKAGMTADEAVASSSRLQILKKESTFGDGMILDEKTGIPGTSKEKPKRDGPKKRKYRCKVCRVVFAEMGIFKIHKCMCIDPIPVKDMQVRGARKKKPVDGQEKKETPKKDKDKKDVVNTDEISKTMTKFKSKRDKNDYTCKQCGKLCTSRPGFLNHMEEHNKEHAAPTLRYDCDQCGEKFRTWEARRTHIYRDHLKKAFCKCVHCGKEFMDTNILRVHIRENHTEDFPGYQCEKCGKDFRSKKQFGMHNKQHTNEFSCRLCMKVLKSQNAFLRHMDTHAGKNGEKNYKCEACGKKFANDFTLIAHYKKTHPEMPHLVPENNDAILAESWAQRTQ